MLARLALVVLVGGSLSLALAAENPLEVQVQSLAAELRCPVCQNLSVADSPSEMARQMRDLIRERLRQGERPEAVKAYLVERYGEWILLVPPPRGFSLLAWVAPFLGLGGGLAGSFLLLRRWVRRSPRTAREVDPAYLARVRREVEQRKKG
ncbi:MAG: cytochrome c-type biogenesis protein CcmH [Anaerolineae bacterium]